MVLEKNGAALGPHRAWLSSKSNCLMVLGSNSRATLPNTSMLQSSMHRASSECVVSMHQLEVCTGIQDALIEYASIKYVESNQ